MKYWFLLLIFMPCFCQAQSHTLKIATYNIRYDNAEDVSKGNGWSKRCPVIAQLIRFQDFDLFGTQEGLDHQLKNLRDSLQGYAYFGIGRDDGKDKGEHSAIFYKTNMFRLLDKGDFWLSTATDHPNKGWDAALPRICSWGLFRVKSTGYTFYCFNLHMDHQGVIARRESVKLVMAVIRKKAGNMPVLLLGDFNADQHDECYNTVQTSGLLKDAYELAPVRWAPTESFNGFDLQRCGDSRIDHIFLTKSLRVQRYAILNNTYPDCSSSSGGDKPTAVLRVPSDHYPVMAIIDY